MGTIKWNQGKRCSILIFYLLYVVGVLLAYSLSLFCVVGNVCYDENDEDAAGWNGNLGGVLF